MHGGAIDFSYTSAGVLRLKKMRIIMATLFGTSGNDTLTGTAGEDRLVGSAGNDIMDGAGNGIFDQDHVDYTGTMTGGAITGGLTINNTNVARGGVAAYTVDKGPQGMDVLSGIESVIGSDFNDTIYIDGLTTVDDQVFVLDGSGNDTVIGFDASGNSSGLDIIVGSGNDTYTGIGINSNDRLQMSDWGIDGAGAMFQGVTVNFTGDKQGTLVDGWGGNDTFTGFGRITGSQFADVMNGNVGDERLQGREGDDTLNGGAGEDRLTGGQGNDVIDGGAGNRDEAQYDGNITDYALVDNGNGTYSITDTNLADGDEGTDTLSNIEYFWFDGTRDYVSLNAMLLGATNGDDLIDQSGATGSVDAIGLDGNDTLIGSAFDDDLQGNAGNDSLVGGDGNDDLFGGDGDDIINAVDPGGPDFDYIEPGAGNDTITGDGDDGIYYRNLGRDDTTGTDWGVTVDIAAGTAVSNSNGATNDTFTGIRNVGGTQYDDVLLGSDNGWRFEANGWQGFQGQAGNDVINGRGGWDAVEYNWDDGPGGIAVDLANNRITDTHGDTDTVHSIELIQGTAQVDTFIGDAGENSFRGLQGDDTLDGGAGIRDTADYSEDERRGGTQGINANLAAGLIVDGFGDTDTVSNIEFVTGTDFADTMLAADTFGAVLDGRGGDDTLTGGAMGDILWGGGGSDTLNAMGGNDRIGGLAGSNNTVDGGIGFDAAYLDGNRSDFSFAQTASGWDVTDTRDGTVNQISNVEQFQFNDGTVSEAQIAQGTGSNDDTVDRSGATGPALIDVGAGNDAATGSAFDDVITAGSGNDSVSAGDGNDVVTASSGSNDLSGDAGDDVISALNGQNTLSGGSDNDFVMGGIGNDVIDGGTGDDVLMGDITAGGFGGADRIDGGAGNDLMMGGVGSDTFVFEVGDGTDQIGSLAVDVADPTGGTTITGGDFEVGADKIELRGFGYADGAEALSKVSDVGGVAVFEDLANGLSITLHGLQTADLSASDFDIV